MYTPHWSILMLTEIGLFPVSGRYKQSCYKHSCICRWVNKCTTFPQVYNKVELLNRVGACLDFIDAAKLLLLNAAVLSIGCSGELLVELYKGPESRAPPLDLPHQNLWGGSRHLYFWKASPVIHLHTLGKEPPLPSCGLDFTSKTRCQLFFQCPPNPWTHVQLLVQLLVLLVQGSSDHARSLWLTFHAGDHWCWQASVMLRAACWVLPPPTHMVLLSPLLSLLLPLLSQRRWPPNLSTALLFSSSVYSLATSPTPMIWPSSLCRQLPNLQLSPGISLVFSAAFWMFSLGVSSRVIQ